MRSNPSKHSRKSRFLLGVKPGSPVVVELCGNREGKVVPVSSITDRAKREKLLKRVAEVQARRSLPPPTTSSSDVISPVPAVIASIELEPSAWDRFDCVNEDFDLLNPGHVAEWTDPGVPWEG
jgi:hypothetical protein